LDPQYSQPINATADRRCLKGDVGGYTVHKQEIIVHIWSGVPPPPALIAFKIDQRILFAAHFMSCRCRSNRFYVSKNGAPKWKVEPKNSFIAATDDGCR